jgi:hypothetical protein
MVVVVVLMVLLVFRDARSCLGEAGITERPKKPRAAAVTDADLSPTLEALQANAEWVGVVVEAAAAVSTASRARLVKKLLIFKEGR